MSIFYVLPPPFQVFLEVESVVAAAELSPEVLVLVAEPEVASVVAEPEVVFVAVVSVAEPPVSVDIAVAFVALVPAAVVVGEVDSSGRPKFPAVPNVDHFANSSSSVEVVGEVSVHSSTGARTNHGLCSSPSNLDPHQNRNVGQFYNNSSFGYDKVSDTNDLPIDATTNHSRKRGLHQCQEKHRHSSQVSLSHLEVRQIK